MANTLSGADTFRALEAISKILHELNIHFFVGGSVASSLRGEFRATNDVDLVCFITPQTLEPFISALQSDFFADAEYIRSAVGARRSFNIIEKISCLKIDIFTNVGSFERSQLDRASLVRLVGTETSIPVASAEDSILAKLVWYRKGGETSEQQWKDINGVVRVHGDQLDRGYLKNWAELLGVSDLLDKLIGEIGG